MILKDSFNIGRPMPTPGSRLLHKGGGLASSIVAKLAYWLTSPIEDVSYPDKIGGNDAIARNRSCYNGDGVGYYSFTQKNIGTSHVIRGTFGNIETSGARYILGGYLSSVANGINTSGSNQLYYRANGGNVILTFSTFDWSDGMYSFICTRDGGNVSVEVTKLSTGTTDTKTGTITSTNEMTLDRVGAISNFGIMQGVVQSAEIDGVANWQFCEGSGNVVYDVSGNGNHLSGADSGISASNWGVINTPDKDYLAEHGGNFAGRFNGVDDFIDTGIDLEGSSFVDLTVRLYKPSVDSENNVVQYQTAAYSCGVYWASGSIYALVGAGAGGNAFGRYTSSLTGWVKIRMVFDGSLTGNENRLKLYVNDIQVAFTQITGTIPTEAPPISNNLWLGRRGSVYDDGKVFHIKLISDSVTLLDNYVTGIDHRDTFGTWSGSGDHTAIIPARQDTALDALGQPLVYGQNGKQVIPETFFSLPEAAELIAADEGNKFFTITTDAPKLINWTDILGDNYTEQFWYINAEDRKDFMLIAEGETLTTDELVKLKKYLKII